MTIATVHKRIGDTVSSFDVYYAPDYGYTMPGEVVTNGNLELLKQHLDNLFSEDMRRELPGFEAEMEIKVLAQKFEFLYDYMPYRENIEQVL